jgi:hypothetical protein
MLLVGVDSQHCPAGVRRRPDSPRHEDFPLFSVRSPEEEHSSTLGIRCVQVLRMEATRHTLCCGRCLTLACPDGP